jgi:hypothetical protein
MVDTVNTDCLGALSGKTLADRFADRASRAVDDTYLAVESPSQHDAQYCPSWPHRAVRLRNCNATTSLREDAGKVALLASPLSWSTN